jgi:hypothetical protein
VGERVGDEGGEGGFGGSGGSIREILGSTERRRLEVKGHEWCRSDWTPKDTSIFTGGEAWPKESGGDDWSRHIQGN